MQALLLRIAVLNSTETVCSERVYSSCIKECLHRGNLSRLFRHAENLTVSNKLHKQKNNQQTLMNYYDNEGDILTWSIIHRNNHLHYAVVNTFLHGRITF